MSNSPLPLTILSGYLGAGKTTLIRRLLSNPTGERIGVLVNDFGSINLDEKLIADSGGETVSLVNGCVCCSIRDDLGLALDAMVACAVSLDRLILEASGVADPSRLRGYAETWPGVTSRGVLTVADIRRVRALCHDKFVGETVLRQLQSADGIYLSYVDEAADIREMVVGWIREKATVPVITSFDPSKMNWLLHFEKEVHCCCVTSGDTPVEHFSETIVRDTPLNEAFIETLLDNPPKWIMRVKGWFCRDDQPEVVYQIQGVPGTWSVNPGKKFLESDLYVNIVIIWADPEKDATAVRDLFGVP